MEQENKLTQMSEQLQQLKKKMGLCVIWYFKLILFFTLKVWHSSS